MNDLTAADHDDATLFFDLSDETIEWRPVRYGRLAR